MGKMLEEYIKNFLVNENETEYTDTLVKERR